MRGSAEADRRWCLLGEGQGMGRTWVVRIKWDSGHPSLWNMTLLPSSFVKLFILFLWYWTVLHSWLFTCSSFSWLQRWVYLKAQFFYLTSHISSYIIQVQILIQMTPEPIALALAFLLLFRSFCFRVLLSYKICYFKTAYLSPLSWWLPFLSVAEPPVFCF